MKTKIKLLTVVTVLFFIASTSFSQEISEKQINNFKIEVEQMGEVADLSDVQKATIVVMKKELFLAKQKATLENPDNKEAYEKAYHPALKKYYKGMKETLTPEQDAKLKAYWAERNKKK